MVTLISGWRSPKAARACSDRVLVYPKGETGMGLRDNPSVMGTGLLGTRPVDGVRAEVDDVGNPGAGTGADNGIEGLQIGLPNILHLTAAAAPIPVEGQVNQGGDLPLAQNINDGPLHIVAVDGDIVNGEGWWTGVEGHHLVQALLFQLLEQAGANVSRGSRKRLPH